eukprot:s2258_g5.t1
MRLRTAACQHRLSQRQQTWQNMIQNTNAIDKPALANEASIPKHVQKECAGPRTCSSTKLSPRLCAQNARGTATSPKQPQDLVEIMLCLYPFEARFMMWLIYVGVLFQNDVAVLLSRGCHTVGG